MISRAFLALLSLATLGCAHAVTADAPRPARSALPADADPVSAGVHWFNWSVTPNLDSVGALFGPDAVPCGTWLAVESVTPGRAEFRILPHIPSETKHPYIVGYACLHEPAHQCPGDEGMDWPDGVLGDRMTFLAPSGGPYFLIVAKYVQDKTGAWIPTRGCDTVVIPMAR